MDEKYYAHSKKDAPPSEWQPLEKHLTSVAEMARRFADSFGAGDWAYWAGMWHDRGKYSKEFQDYLKSENNIDASIETAPGRRDHSSAGAQHAVCKAPILGHLLAYAIAGHHAGLLNGRDIKTCQEKRLGKTIYPWEHGLKYLTTFSSVEPPHYLRSALSKKDEYSVAFFIRMIFSCLVDADFLNTENFMDSEKSAKRENWPDDVLTQMEDALTGYILQLDPQDTLVNRQRTLVREACLEAAKKAPGLFSLSVPTGGGKTLASFAFALRHAIRNNLHRVIYVIPLTSIIEQNAEVFRKILRAVARKHGRNIVIEHHSNLDPEKETEINRLAAENWDAPLIVTTSVQFYESLFSHKTSRCRKLHRMARSVVILDEAQTLPVDYLEPCLRALRELTVNYGASVVICTATQPAIERRKGFEIGLQKPFEIIPNAVDLYSRLKRVSFEDIGNQSDQELCRRIMCEPKVPCIVNTKAHAKKLFKAIGKDEGHFHLSGNMWPAHRSEILEQIRNHLEKGSVCRVISTQVIEAGVDVDFPTVYRSLAGLDSIAQAAGRCNRNGTLPEGGHTYIFRSEHKHSERFFADTAQCADQILSLYDSPLDLKATEHYFKLYYWDQNDRWDEKKIMDEFALINDQNFPFNFGFSRIDKKFALIDEAGYCPVIIPWREQGHFLCERLRAMPVPTMEIRRQLQRLVVQIPKRVWELHINKEIELVHDGFFVLTNPQTNYSENTGLNLEAEGHGAIFS